MILLEQVQAEMATLLDQCAPRKVNQLVFVYDETETQKDPKSSQGEQYLGKDQSNPLKASLSETGMFLREIPHLERQKYALLRYHKDDSRSFQVDNQETHKFLLVDHQWRTSVDWKSIGKSPVKVPLERTKNEHNTRRLQQRISERAKEHLRKLEENQ